MTYLAAVIQLDTGKNIDDNWEQAEHLIRQAAAKGAKLVVLPEHAVYEGRCSNEQARQTYAIAFKRFSALARELRIYLHCGTLFEVGPEGKPYNTSLLFDTKGRLLTSYQKVHLFDVAVEAGPQIQESKTVSAGRRFVVAQTEEVGNLGLSICYDLRFPEQFRLLALEGAQVFVVPANFTYPTGRAHWEVLLRARAVENGAYVLAAAQCGKKSGYLSYGHSMIIDPWGQVLAEAEESPKVLLAPILLEEGKRVRSQLGLFHNRRTDLYRLIGLDFV